MTLQMILCSSPHLAVTQTETQELSDFPKISCLVASKTQAFPTSALFFYGHVASPSRTWAAHPNPCPPRNQRCISPALGESLLKN